MRRAVLIAAIAAVAWPTACNVFVSLDRCQGDGDCPASAVCDLEARICVRVDGGAGDGGLGPDAVVDAPYDAADTADAVPDATPPCDLAAPFGTPVLVAGLEHLPVSTARFMDDETTVLFSALNGCTQESCQDLFIAGRASRGAPFVVSGLLPRVNSVSSEYWPTVTADAKVLFFESSRSVEKVDGGYVNDVARVWSATRQNTAVDFDEPRLQSIFETSTGYEGAPYLHPGGRTLYFISGARPGKGDLDIFLARLAVFGVASSVENLDSVNTDRAELAPVVSFDDRSLYFAREVLPTLHRDIYRSTRADPGGVFGPAAPVAELNTVYDEFPSWISDDECRLYFVSNRPSPTGDAGGTGTYRLWVTARPH